MGVGNRELRTLYLQSRTLSQIHRFVYLIASSTYPLDCTVFLDSSNSLYPELNYISTHPRIYSAFSLPISDENNSIFPVVQAFHNPSFSNTLYTTSVVSIFKICPNLATSYQLYNYHLALSHHRLSHIIYYDGLQTSLSASILAFPDPQSLLLLRSQSDPLKINVGSLLCLKLWNGFQCLSE